MLLSMRGASLQSRSFMILVVVSAAMAVLCSPALADTTDCSAENAADVECAAVFGSSQESGGTGTTGGGGPGGGGGGSGRVIGGSGSGGSGGTGGPGAAGGGNGGDGGPGGPAGGSGDWAGATMDEDPPGASATGGAAGGGGLLSGISSGWGSGNTGSSRGSSGGAAGGGIGSSPELMLASASTPGTILLVGNASFELTPTVEKTDVRKPEQYSSRAQSSRSSGAASGKWVAGALVGALGLVFAARRLPRLAFGRGSHSAA